MVRAHSLAALGNLSANGAAEMCAHFLCAHGVLTQDVTGANQAVLLSWRANSFMESMHQAIKATPVRRSAAPLLQIVRNLTASGVC